MASTGFTALNDAANKMSEALNNMNIGATELENNITSEEKILKLKESNKFIEYKLKVKDVIIAINEPATNLKVDISNENLIPLEKLVGESNIKAAIRISLLTNILCKLYDTDDPRFDTYKQKIIDEFPNLQKKKECINIVHKRCDEVFCEKLASDDQIHKQTASYGIKIEKERKHVLEERQSKLDDAYKQTLEKIQIRLEKVNVMRVLTSRLILKGKVDFSKHKKLYQILKQTRASTTIQSLAGKSKVPLE